MVFSDGPLGEQWLLPSVNGAMLSTAQQLLITALPFCLVGTVLFALRWYPERSADEAGEQIRGA